MSVLSNSMMKLALFAAFVLEVSAYIYYPNRPGNGFCQRQNVCYSRFNGYYCCNGYWYSTGWAISMYVFFSLLLIGCLVWCCIAGGSKNETTQSYTLNPSAQIIQVRAAPATQPKPVTATSGDSHVVSGGTYTVTGQAVESEPPIQGVNMDEIEMDHYAPAARKIKSPVDTV